MREMSVEEEQQRQHYDVIGEAYQSHYADRWSLQYRDRFMHGPMLDGLDLNGIKALEVMCGGGYATQYLLKHGAQVTGLDVSQTQIDAFLESCPEATGRCASVLDTEMESQSMDLVVAVMGLHHLHPHLDDAMVELHRVLKPGGHLCFCEPHFGSLPDIARRRWYALDPLFCDDEASVNIKALHQSQADRFAPVKERYMGSVAYIAVLNSMILRMPHAIKALYSPLFMQVEGFVNRLLTPATACYVACQWRRL